MMKTGQARDAFAALAQETRLSILRHLIRKGLDALPAGQIAEALDIPPSTFSFHIAALERAGLVKSERNQRQILYAPNLDGIRELLKFLLDDCCGGHPEICADLVPQARSKARSTAACCDTQPVRKAKARGR